VAILTNSFVHENFQIIDIQLFFSLARSLQRFGQHRHKAVQGRKTVKTTNASNANSQDQDNVLKSTLITTVAALALITTLFLTAFASIEAAASPVHHDGDARALVSVRYLA
jgi:hypothetical protein|tara:strand:- start:45136 stop:45468 length:333 start_codon:yes stop_codon:yes gene_type:complete